MPLVVSASSRTRASRSAPSATRAQAVVDQRQEALEGAQRAGGVVLGGRRGEQRLAGGPVDGLQRREVGRVGGQGRDDVGVVGDGAGRGGVLDVGRDGGPQPGQVGGAEQGRAGGVGVVEAGGLEGGVEVGGHRGQPGLGARASSATAAARSVSDRAARTCSAGSGEPHGQPAWSALQGPDAVVGGGLGGGQVVEGRGDRLEARHGAGDGGAVRLGGCG